MKRDLVTLRDGRRVINWPVVLLVGLVVGIVSGCSAAATWYVLTQEFSVVATLFPVFASVGFFAGIAIRKIWLPSTVKHSVFD